MRKPVLPSTMVDRSQSLKLTLSLLRPAKAGWWTPNVNPPNPLPGHDPGSSRPRLLPRSRQQRQPLAAGFTLVELLIVVVIIGVLSGVATPAFLGQRNRASINAANMQARGLMSYCLAHFIDRGEMPNARDKEYKRLAKAPKSNIIQWTNESTEDRCKIRITSEKLKLSPPGIFSVQLSGDATTIKATPARIKR